MDKGKRKYAVAVGLCCVGLMIGSCTQGPESAGGAISGTEALAPASPAVDAAAELAHRGTQMVEPSWSVKMKVLDRPRVANGVVVVLSEGAKGLQLVGLKETTGKKLWGVSVVPGWVPSGVNMVVELSKTAKGKDVALFLEESKPRDGWSGDVGGASLFLAAEETPTLLDTRTGKTINVAAGERFLCTKDAKYTKPEDGNGGTLLYPCAAGGKKARGVSAGALQAQDSGESHVVLGFAGAVAAFPVDP